MARSVDDIMAGLIASKNAQPGLQMLSNGSVTAIWRLLLYVVAVGCHVVELLIDEHRSEVDELLATKVPHRAKWYRDMTLKFMVDRSLVADNDYYETSGMSDDDITQARVVKHAVAVEDGRNSMLTIKVAGENATTGAREPICDEQVRQLGAYLAEIKDAGVKINVVNRHGDLLNASVDVYYDAMREATHVRTACEGAIKDYIENLRFNGEYTNMALVDRLQAVSGVKVVEFGSASAQEAGVDATIGINARYTPVAGYFSPGAITINMIPYE